MSIIFCQSQLQAAESEMKRLDGFRQFKKDSQAYDYEREKAYSAYLENLEKEAFDREKAIEDYRKNKKKTKPLEDTPAYLDDLQVKLAWQKKYEEDLQSYKAQREAFFYKKQHRPFSEEYELDILSNRPRYEYQKRALYGAKPKYKKVPMNEYGGAPASGMPYLPSDAGNDSSDIPPPPPLPPDISQPFLDEIPPPPPMPMDGGYDYNGDGNDGDFIPPPPPPPMFDGEF
ncbi:MAG: hypothetical protein KDD45_02690 [Bdellovibrionales bacterium]|nr:hypothetical protein [Bdellovibrionales bacterium]